MSDVVERIRGLRYVHVPVASQLFEEACQEIERLRQVIADSTQPQDATPSEGSVHGDGTSALTDAEREAVELAYSRLTADTNYASVAATLRGLLERLGGGK